MAQFARLRVLSPRVLLPQTLPELAAFGTVAAFAVLPRIVGTPRGCRIAERIGRPCPLCGGTRALHAIRAGDASAAWSANKLVTSAVAVGLVSLPGTTLRRLGLGR